MERRGFGLRKIIEAYEFVESYREELKAEFRSTESSFLPVIKKLNYVGENVGQSEGQKLCPSKRCKKIVVTLEYNSKTTIIELSKLLDASDRTIKRDLTKLTEGKIVEYVGSAKDGEWIVKNKGSQERKNKI